MSSYPNLWNNRTIMGKLLTSDVFSRVKDKKCTSKGYGIDQLIECGINYLTDYEQIKSGKLRQT